MTIYIESLVDSEQGLVSRRIFVEPQIYEGELERIFARCWLFLCHESGTPRERFAPFSTSAVIAATGCAARTSATPPASRAATTGGPIATTAGWSACPITRRRTTEVKEVTRLAGVRGFSPSGTFEQDDMDNWQECTRVGRRVEDRPPHDHPRQNVLLAKNVSIFF
ncbi:MAG TPA: hypothetical protein VK548_27990 [Candidatus Acidoferrum sp.]|nr:hypothetical protein [Candidatus Acidoferrum sp.]